MAASGKRAVGAMERGWETLPSEARTQKAHALPFPLVIARAEGPWQSIQPFRLLYRFGEPTCPMDCHGATRLAMTKGSELRFFTDHKQAPKVAGGTITNCARND